MELPRDILNIIAKDVNSYREDEDDIDILIINRAITVEYKKAADVFKVVFHIDEEEFLFLHFEFDVQVKPQFYKDYNLQKNMRVICDEKKIKVSLVNGIKFKFAAKSTHKYSDECTIEIEIEDMTTLAEKFLAAKERGAADNAQEAISEESIKYFCGKLKPISTEFSDSYEDRITIYETVTDMVYISSNNDCERTAIFKTPVDFYCWGIDIEFRLTTEVKFNTQNANIDITEKKMYNVIGSPAGFVRYTIEGENTGLRDFVFIPRIRPTDFSGIYIDIAALLKKNIGH